MVEPTRTLSNCGDPDPRFKSLEEGLEVLKFSNLLKEEKGKEEKGKGKTVSLNREKSKANQKQINQITNNTTNQTTNSNNQNTNNTTNTNNNHTNNTNNTNTTNSTNTP